MPWVYILECADGSFYTGSTIDLERRLAQHALGEGANYTRTRLPVRLVFAEEIARIDDAFAREKQLQGWSRAKKAALIDGRWSELQVLARRRGEAGGPFENLRDRTQPGRQNPGR